MLTCFLAQYRVHTHHAAGGLVRHMYVRTHLGSTDNPTVKASTSLQAMLKYCSTCQYCSFNTTDAMQAIRQATCRRRAMNGTEAALSYAQPVLS